MAYLVFKPRSSGIWIRIPNTNPNRNPFRKTDLFYNLQKMFRKTDLFYNLQKMFRKTDLFYNLQKMFDGRTCPWQTSWGRRTRWARTEVSQSPSSWPPAGHRAPASRTINWSYMIDKQSTLFLLLKMANLSSWVGWFCRLTKMCTYLNNTLIVQSMNFLFFKQFFW